MLEFIKVSVNLLVNLQLELPVPLSTMRVWVGKQSKDSTEGI